MLRFEHNFMHNAVVFRVMLQSIMYLNLVQQIFTSHSRSCHPGSKPCHCIDKNLFSTFFLFSSRYSKNLPVRTCNFPKLVKQILTLRTCYKITLFMTEYQTELQKGHRPRFCQDCSHFAAGQGDIQLWTMLRLNSVSEGGLTIYRDTLYIGGSHWGGSQL